MIKNQKAYFLTDSQVSTLSYLIQARLGMLDGITYPQLREEEREELLFIKQALLHSSLTIESLMIENHQLRNRIQGLELEKAVNKLENEEAQDGEND